MKTSSRLALLVLSFATFALQPSAQSASYTVTGTSCTTGRISMGLEGVPLFVRGVPRLGTTFEIVTEGTTSYPWGSRRNVFLATGLSNTMVNGVALPIDLAALRPGEPFCGLLQTSGEIMTRVPTVPDYRTPAVIAITVPNDLSLLGLVLYQQVMSYEFSSFGPPFRSAALSPLGTMTIGF